VIYDWEREPWDFECDVDTMQWPWPTFAAPIGPDSFYEPCPLGCSLGAATYGTGLSFECPACGGSGLGPRHEC
jgi:hypothetical protein